MITGTLEGLFCNHIGNLFHLYVFPTGTGQTHPRSIPLGEEPVDVGRGER